MIDYQRDLNQAQLEAVTSLEGPVLVIAGAGSGKTRTIVYRLARLVESGVPAAQILLLTFTRKAAHEMLERARRLLDRRDGAAMHGLETLAHVQGGTFHAYAYSVLRVFRPEGYAPGLTVMDGHDIQAALQHCREELKIAKGDRSFPRNQTINSLLSKSRNKEAPLEDILRREAGHLMPHAPAMLRLAEAYAAYKREKNLLDYDDLLFCLEQVLLTRPEALARCRDRHRYLMVDEYQDTNPVQARIAALVAGLDPAPSSGPEPSPSGAPARPGLFKGNIMAVGDDAQSIYAFRGADVRNILRFPEIFPGTRLIRLEENYRSTQPLLDLSNQVLSHAAEGYGKRLFTSREGGDKPSLVRPLSDRSQAALVAGRIAELLRFYPPGDIAVLFRAGFHSYALEMAMSKMGLAFRKYGGIRYTEASHVKDAMSFVRLALNPLDYTAFTRMAALSKGVGPKTCLKIYQIATSGDAAALEKALLRHPDLSADLRFVEDLRRSRPRPANLLLAVIEHYAPRMASLFPDDHPRRLQGLEHLVQTASAYDDLDLMVADLSLEDPGEERERGDAVALSTVHSAKGLEWGAVIVIDLVEDRFPSRHAMVRPEDFEEERRLMYVACTRARDELHLYVPASMYDKGSGGNMPATPSPFVRELSPDVYIEWQEGYTGALVEKQRRSASFLSGTARAGRGAASMTGRGAASMTGRGAASMTGRGAASMTGREAAFASGPDAAARDAPERLPDFDGPAPACFGDGAPEGFDEAAAPQLSPGQCGFCRHKIFGRGKIVQHLPPDKVRVNFPGLGLKVILRAYLSLED